MMDVTLTNKRVHSIALSGVIAAIYAGMTLLIYPYSFGAVQFRISECLCVLPLFFPEAVPGLFVGCIVSNIMSPNIPVLDLILGSAATLIASFLISKLNGGKAKKAILAPLINTVINSFIVAFVITVSYSDVGESAAAIYLTNFVQIAIGEAAVGYFLGVPLMLMLSKKIDKN